MSEFKQIQLLRIATVLSFVLALVNHLLPPKAFAATQLLFDYSQGFTRRGLVGRRPTRAATRTDPVLKDKWVLIADDEDVIRETVRDVLVSYGCRVDEARDGKAAIELVAANGYDLVLSDIKMPGASGYEVFAASKDKDADRPVLPMTGFGYDPNHSIVRARREGLAAVLFKPFKVDQLLGEIRNAVRTASSGK